MSKKKIKEVKGERVFMLETIPFLIPKINRLFVRNLHMRGEEVN